MIFFSCCFLIKITYGNLSLTNDVKSKGERPNLWSERARSACLGAKEHKGQGGLMYEVLLESDTSQVVTEWHTSHYRPKFHTAPTCMTGLPSRALWISCQPVSSRPWIWRRVTQPRLSSLLQPATGWGGSSTHTSTQPPLTSPIHACLKTHI